MKVEQNPQVVPNLYKFLCSVEHKGKYFEECGKLNSSGALLTSLVNVTVAAWLQTFFKISPFVFSRTKKCIHFGTT